MKQPEVVVWMFIDPLANLTRCYNNLEDLLQLLHQDTWTFTPTLSRLGGGTQPLSRQGRLRRHRTEAELFSTLKNSRLRSYFF